MGMEEVKVSEHISYGRSETIEAGFLRAGIVVFNQFRQHVRVWGGPDLNYTETGLEPARFDYLIGSDGKVRDLMADREHPDGEAAFYAQAFPAYPGDEQAP